MNIKKCAKCVDQQFNPGFHFNPKSGQLEIVDEVHEMADILHEYNVGGAADSAYGCDYHFHMAQQLHMLRFRLK